jgi:glycerol-3-phosphate dehydrogenase
LDKTEKAIRKANKKLQAAWGDSLNVRRLADHLVLSGEAPDRVSLVNAGYIAAKASKTVPGCLVNDATVAGEEPPSPIRLPQVSDTTLDGQTPDVLVIGGGIVGCAVARELTRYTPRVLLLEKENDVALHASSRNDGMVHPGVDVMKWTDKYKYNIRGNAMYKDFCAELGVPYRMGGQYLCFPKKVPVFVLHLLTLYWKLFLKVPVRVLTHKKLFALEPDLNPEINACLQFPTAGSVCPYNLTIACAENAIGNGAAVALETAALRMDVADGQITAVHTNRGTIYPKLIINAAGVFSEDVAAMAHDRFFSIHPRRGTNSILDKKFSDSIARDHSSTLFMGAVKGGHTKGGGVIRTIHDNILLGPDAHEDKEKEDFSTTRESVAGMVNKQRRTSQNIQTGQVITYFTGVRAATFEEDFVVRPGLYTKNILHAAGIQSPGLTAAPAIAQTIANWAAMFLGAESRPEFQPERKPIIHTSQLPPEERDRLIRQNPDYGIILCRCEQVSKGEILEALHRPLPCKSVDAVKRRVRAGMGRCQGGFCGPLVAKIIAQDLGIPLCEVLKNGAGSEILLGSSKELLLAQEVTAG